MPLFYGKDVRRRGDQLHACTAQQVHSWISRPSGTLYDRVGQLRELYTIDPARYSELKAGLPYFLGSSFHPAARRKENFAAIEYFVVDLDHFDAPEAPDLVRTRESLCQRDDLLLCFLSPGGQGLKLLFQLSSPCRDVGLYRAFYQSFLQRLAQSHDLGRVVDTVTHDVTRVCFFSHDTKAYFHPEAEKVEFAQYVNTLDPDLPDRIERLNKASNKPGGGARVPGNPDQPATSGPDEDTLLLIKQKLNPRFRPRPKPRTNAKTPEAIEQVLPSVIAMLEENGISLMRQTPIQYGKQLRFSIGNFWAEINLFHGRRGFTIVKTAKSGSHADLAELCHQLMQDYFNQYT